MANDIRWKQRFSNFQKAKKQLDYAVCMDHYSDLERLGLIKCFEYTIELAWKTLQDLLAAKGYDSVKGPKPVVKQAFQDGYITDGNAWIIMLDSRNETVHIYDEELAQKIAEEIINTFYPLLSALERRLLQEKI